MTVDASPESGSLGIALGGGAARGLCHIGVLRVLSAKGIAFPVVAGTSIGAIIGAAYVSGKIDEAEKIARSVTARTMAGWADVNLHSGALKGDVVKSIFHDFVGDMTFRDLRDRGINFVVVAADLDSEEPVYITEGRIDEAVRASMSIPGIFEPVTVDGRVLVDGGLIDNVPVGAARTLGARKVIGVEVHNPYDIWVRTAIGLGMSVVQMREMKARFQELAKEPHVPWQKSLEAYHGVSRKLFEGSETVPGRENHTGDSRTNGLRRLAFAKNPRVREMISRLHVGTARKERVRPRDGEGWTAFRATLVGLDIISSLLEQGREPFRPNVPADLFIRPDVRRFHAHQFYRASRLIAEGVKAATEALPQVEALLKEQTAMTSVSPGFHCPRYLRML